MMRHLPISSIVLIACATCSLGVILSYPPNYVVHFAPGENITITCSGMDEVTWEIDCPPTGVYSVRPETTKRKILEIVNSTPHNSGVYKCYSRKHRDEFMKVYLAADNPKKYANNKLESEPPKLDGSTSEPPKTN